jgi:hydroxypyruvate isomerase
MELIYEDLPFLDRVDRVAEYGFETVEFWTWHDKDLEAIEVRVGEHILAALAAAGYNGYVGFELAPAQETEAALDAIGTVLG